MKDIKTNIGVSIKYGKANFNEKQLDKLGEEIIKPYREQVITTTKQSTKEMFEKMTAFFFKNLCNCKK